MNQGPVVTNSGKQNTPGEWLRSCAVCDSAAISPYFEAQRIWRCHGCGLIFRNPRPRKEDLSVLYRDAYRDESMAPGTTHMAGTTLSLARGYVRSLARTFELRGKQVLDFGAGLGAVSMALNELGAQVIAVEPFAWRECEKAGIRVYRSLSELPGTVRFDLVVAIQVIEHLPLPWDTLKELRDLLKPGGWLYVATPNSSGLNACLRRGRWREILKPTHLMFFTPKTLKRTLEKAGFERSIRLKGLVRYSDNPAKRILHSTLQLLALGGDLRYLAQKFGPSAVCADEVRTGKHQASG